MTGKPKAMAPSPRQPFSGQGVLRISGPAMRRIATWNVRSLFQSGKTHNAIREMERLNIDILGISEMRWPNSGQCVVDGYHVYYAGNNEPHHFNGVGFIVHPNISKTVRKFVPVSDRVIFLQLNAQPILVNLIQVYAPTCDASDDDIEEFYTQLKTALSFIKLMKVTIVCVCVCVCARACARAHTHTHAHTRTHTEQSEININFFLLHSELKLKSPAQENDTCFKGKLLLIQQSSSRSVTYSDKRDETNLPNVRSISLMDLQDPSVTQCDSGSMIHDAPVRLTGSQLSVIQMANIKQLHSTPQSAPQVRRPLHSALNQPGSLQPLSFQNPVYHLNNPPQPMPKVSVDSSLENLSVTSSRSQNSEDLKLSGPSNSSMEDFTKQSTQSEDFSRRGPLLDKHMPIALPRQNSTGQAQVRKMDQAGLGARVKAPQSLPHSASLRSTGSMSVASATMAAEPLQNGTRSRQQSSSSRESPVPKVRAIQRQQTQQVGLSTLLPFVSKGDL